MFITFEGPEGSGKTTVLDYVEKALLERGIPLVRTREPGGTPISEQIREVILNKSNTEMDPRTEALLYAASRRQHLVEKIWPALRDGKVVLCDRYLDSSLAYQGAGRNIGVDNILNMNLFATEDTWPDLTILFDINPELGMERIAANSNREVNRLDLEQIEFHKKVRDEFLKLAKQYKKRYVVVDASLPLDTVEAEVLDIILKRL